LVGKLVAFVKSPEFQEGIQKLIAWLEVALPIAIQIVSDVFVNVLIPAIQAVWTFIGEFVKVVAAWWEEHGATVIAIVEGIWEVIMEIYQRAREAIENIIELFHLAQAGDWTAFGEKIRDIVNTLWDNVKTIFKNAIDSVIKFFTETDWKSVGLSIIQGIANGITSGVSWIVNAAKAAAQAAFDAVKGFLGIDSPSKVFIEIGGEMMQGMARGILNMAKLPELAMIAATPIPMSNYNVANNKTNNVSINMGGVNITNGADHQAFISQVEWAVQRALGVFIQR